MLIQSIPVIRNVEINLPSSKSISNRLLILNALSENSAPIHNLSVAQDTVVLDRLLHGDSKINNCQEGGTTSRFLLSLRCVQNKPCLITGTPALCKRPMAPLLNALKSLGAEFEFAGSENHLPVKIVKGITKGGVINIPADISSQFVSALMMIGPVLNGGLILRLKNEPVSVPYLYTTASLMRHFGASVTLMKDQIHIPESGYFPVETTVGADWSAAGYWFALAAALPGSTVRLNGLLADDLQADQQVVQWMKVFGVMSERNENGFLLTSEPVSIGAPLQLDFSNCPDLAQTFAVLAAVKGIPLRLTGIQTLRIKETDRMQALQTELEKAGVKVFTENASMLIESKADVSRIKQQVFDTYGDHRMAMALSLLACTGASVRMNNPEVVGKSYPGYWDDLQSAGFILRE